MHISRSSITVSSTHLAREEYVREESLRAWIGQPPAEGGGQRSSAARPVEDRVSLSAAALNERTETAATAEPGQEEAAVEDPQLRTIRKIIEALTGRRIKVTIFEPRDTAPPEPAPAGGTGEAAAPQRAGWGVDYTLRESFREEETTILAAAGRVTTADGRQIDFKLELVMHREFAAETLVRLQAGDAVLTDPLVINLAGQAAELDGTFFAFDLDLDGQQDDMPLLRPGSGYLAFDRNGDGLVNDGSELFGPATGNGFAELARHDADGNGWLDESDPVFEKLAIWTRSADGSESLTSLRKSAIGALLLEPVSTPFALKDGANASQGRVRETSLFLRESGSVGTIQEIDLVA